MTLTRFLLSVQVNDDLLDEMYDRPIFLRIWDTRDKVSLHTCLFRRHRGSSLVNLPFQGFYACAIRSATGDRGGYTEREREVQGWCRNNRKSELVALTSPAITRQETPSSATSRKSTAGISRPSATGRKSGPRKSGGSAAPKSARTSRKQSDAYGDIDSVYDDYEDPHQEHNDAVLDEIVSTDKFCTAEDGQGTMIQLWLHKFFVQNTTSIGSV